MNTHKSDEWLGIFMLKSNLIQLFRYLMADGSQSCYWIWSRYCGIFKCTILVLVWKERDKLQECLLNRSWSKALTRFPFQNTNVTPCCSRGWRNMFHVTSLYKIQQSHFNLGKNPKTMNSYIVCKVPPDLVHHT
jgi:hypothetical protein